MLCAKLCDKSKLALHNILPALLVTASAVHRVIHSLQHCCCFTPAETFQMLLLAHRFLLLVPAFVLNTVLLPPDHSLLSYL